MRFLFATPRHGLASTTLANNNNLIHLSTGFGSLTIDVIILVRHAPQLVRADRGIHLITGGSGEPNTSERDVLLVGKLTIDVPVEASVSVVVVSAIVDDECPENEGVLVSRVPDTKGGCPTPVQGLLRGP